MKRFAGLLTLWLALGFTQPVQNPMVAIAGKIVGIDAPIQITAETNVVGFDWLENGRYLVYQIVPPESREHYIAPSSDSTLWRRQFLTALYLYDTRTRRTTLIHRDNIDDWRVVLNGRAVLYVVHDALMERAANGAHEKSRATLYLRSPSRSQPKVILQMDTHIGLSCSPNGRYVLVSAPGASEGNPLIDLQTGRTVRTFGSALWVSSVWSDDSTLYLGIHRNRQKDYFVYNVRTNEIKPITESVYRQVIQQKPSPIYRLLRYATRRLRLQTQLDTLPAEGIGIAPLTLEPKYSATLLYLESLEAKTERYRRATVAHDSDSQLCSLAPDESGVAYCNWRGQLFYVPLRPRDPRTLPELLACGLEPTREQIRDYYLSNGKQIALATLMYCADYDEIFPPSQNITDLLFPYVKNHDVFRDAFTGQLIFTYLMDGQTLSSITEPATTPIGRLDWGDPEWVVVLYADGYVKAERRQ